MDFVPALLFLFIITALVALGLLFENRSFRKECKFLSSRVDYWYRSYCEVKAVLLKHGWEQEEQGE